MIKVREQNTTLVSIPLVYVVLFSYLYHGMYHVLKEWKQVMCVVLLPLSWYVPYTKGMETSDVFCSLTFIMVKGREQNNPFVSIPLVYGTNHDKGKRTTHTTCFHSFNIWYIP
jgi:hypothetical protein